MSEEDQANENQIKGMQMMDYNDDYSNMSVYFWAIRPTALIPNSQKMAKTTKFYKLI